MPEKMDPFKPEPRNTRQIHRVAIPGVDLHGLNAEFGGRHDHAGVPRSEALVAQPRLAAVLGEEPLRVGERRAGVAVLDHHRLALSIEGGAFER